jgi:hypothetical protein
MVCRYGPGGGGGAGFGRGGGPGGGPGGFGMLPLVSFAAEPMSLGRDGELPAVAKVSEAPQVDNARKPPLAADPL